MLFVTTLLLSSGLLGGLADGRPLPAASDPAAPAAGGQLTRAAPSGIVPHQVGASDMKHVTLPGRLLLQAADDPDEHEGDAFPPPGFVQRNGTGFVLDGQPYHVVGANQCA